MKFTGLLLICLLALNVHSQDIDPVLNKENLPGQRGMDLGPEFQVYPGGYIPGLRAEFGLGDRSILTSRVGYNIVRHGDLGVHQDERGGGFGVSFGLKRYFSEDFKKWFVGVRNDLWFNDIDWKDNIGLANESAGNSDVIVVQPTAEAGYTFRVGRWFFSPAIAFGWEFNVRTRGQDTGEGAIILGGLSLGLRI